MSLYDYKATTITGEEISLEKYKGKVVLVVNTASKCGFTPQYEGLQKIYEEFEDLEILGFPCDQFGHQEPGSEDEIAEFCKVNYGVSFPLFAKIDVNGGEAHPLFKYLKEKLPGILGSGIKWNFTKFLIDREGKLIRRFAPKDAPAKLRGAIEKLL